MSIAVDAIYQTSGEVYTYGIGSQLLCEYIKCINSVTKAVKIAVSMVKIGTVLELQMWIIVSLVICGSRMEDTLSAFYTNVIYAHCITLKLTHKLHNIMRNSKRVYKYYYLKPNYVSSKSCDVNTNFLEF
jgi:hypothetical protein